MKILLVHKFFHITGGAEVFFFEVGRVLSAHGHDVGYFSTQAVQNVQSTFAQYFVAPPNYTDGSLLRKSLGIGQMVYSRDAKHKFKKLLEDFRPDIVHVFAIQTHISPSILDACHEMDVPVVMSCNDYKHICPNYKLYHHGRVCEDCKGGHFYNAIKNRCCKNSLTFSVASSIESYVHEFLNVYRNNVHTFLFASEFMAHKTEEFWGRDSLRWRILRNPFDTLKNSLYGEDGQYFLYFGRFVEEKGLDVLIHAARLAPDIQLVAVGDGPDRQKLMEQMSDLGLTNVNFVGAKWGEELNHYLRNCRCVIVPSLWHENFPYVILQAFAAGKPVIGSNRGGIPELIQGDQHGLVYEAHDPLALVSAMRKIMEDDATTHQMGERARSYVEKEFNDEAFYNQLMSIYQDVLA